jgi:hypothetical protein
MTEVDPFEYDDAAYVLGALSPAEYAVFEQHLQTCPACQARVAEISRVPALLAGITAEEAFGTDADAARIAAEPMPDTLLPGLIRRAEVRQRRRRWLVGGLASVAAACLIALVAVIAWPSSSSPAPKPFAERTLVQVVPGPVRATATLTAKAWGTEIELDCSYLPGRAEKAFSYDLVAVGPNGHTEHLGSWRLPPDEDIEWSTGTSFTPQQLRRLDITLPDGTTVLTTKV